MTELSSEIEAFELQRSKLEADHNGEWVVFFDRHLHGLFPTMEAAAADAVRSFGRGPYLIRQIGAPPIVLPASVMYHLANA